MTSVTHGHINNLQTNKMLTIAKSITINITINIYINITINIHNQYIQAYRTVPNSKG
jgi:hypothetical protein